MSQIPVLFGDYIEDPDPDTVELADPATMALLTAEAVAQDLERDLQFRAAFIRAVDSWFVGTQIAHPDLINIPRRAHWMLMFTGLTDKMSEVGRYS